MQKKQIKKSSQDNAQEVECQKMTLYFFNYFYHNING